MTNEFYKQLLNQSPLGYVYHKIICDQKGNPIDYEFIEVNPSFESMTGMNRFDILGKKLTEILPRITINDFDWIEFYGNVILNGAEKEIEQYSHVLNRWYRVNAFSYEKKYLVTSIMDITEEKKRLDEINVFFDVDLELLCIVDFEGHFIKVNESWETKLGYSTEELRMKKFIEFVHPDDIQSTLEVMSKLGCKEITDDFVNRYRTKEGTYRYIEWRSQPKGQYIYAAARDITDKINNANVLKEKEQNFHSFFETIDDLLFVGNLNTEIIYVNGTTVEKLGYSYQELYNMNLLDLHPKDRRQEAEKILTDMMEGKRANCHIPFINKQGMLIPVETRVWIGTWNGKPCIFGVVKDLSVTEATLDKFHKLFNNNPALMAITNIEDLRLKEVNEAFCEKLGYEKSEILGKTVLELGLFFETEIQSKVSRILHEKGRIKNTELVIKGKSGQLITGLFSGEVIDNQLEKSFLTVMTDITELKNSEKQLKIKDRILSAVAKSTDILLDSRDYVSAIAKCFELIGEAVDVGRVYLFENRYDEIGNGYASQKIEWNSKKTTPQINNPKLQNIPFKEINSFIRPLKNDEAYYGKINNFDDDVRRLLESQGVRSLIVMPIMINNLFWGFVGFDECRYEKEWSEVEYSILKAFNGSLERAIERQLVEDALKKAKIKAESASIAKGQFLANMSHEIRTPINGIMGMLSLLNYTRLSKEQASYVKEAKTASEMLLYLINDILDVSKIEAGKMNLEKTTFELRSMLEETVSVFIPKTSEKNLELNLFITADVPYRVVGDPARLRQVLNNLLSNALKFTHEGEINLEVIKVSNERIKENTIKLKFIVIDTGIGMSSEVVNKICKPFVQGDASMTREYGGTGLGLAISYDLVKLMNGEFKMQSEEGVGSTFEFTVVFEATEDTNVYKNEYVRLNDVHILVVDDNDTNRQIVRYYLEEFGAHVSEASSGEEALRFLLSNQKENRKIEVVISDYQMPNMNGADLIAASKSIASLKDTKFVLLSSIAQKGDAKQAKKEGFVAYLTKPIKKEDLIGTLSLVLGIKDQNEENQPIITMHLEKEIKRSYQPKILVVEDNLINQKVAVKTLQKRGHQCDIAANGDEALKAWLNHHYDLILMDCQMPIMDGYEATRQIRQIESGMKRTKIVAMTAYAMEGDREKCICAGMDEYLTKPIDFDQVIEIIESLVIEMKKPLNPSFLDQYKEEFIRKSDFNEEETDEIFLDFKKMFVEYLGILEKAMNQNDYETIQEVAHQLKGVSGNLRIEPIMKLAERLYNSSREKGPQSKEIIEKLIQYGKYLL